MSQYILAIDQGTQSNKITIFDLQGKILCSQSQALRPFHLGPNGVVEHPDDDLWDSLQKTCQDLMKKFPGKAEDIIAIGLGSIRFNRVVLRKDGNLAQPVISWLDSRTHAPYKKEVADAAYLTTSTGYLTWRLTGQHLDTVSNYYGWPVDMDTWDWSTNDQLYQYFNVTPKMLFKLVTPGSLLGTITAQAAQKTGLPQGTPVFATANDKAVEALGTGLPLSQDLLLSLGTYVTSMMQGDKFWPYGSSKHFWSNFADIPHEYLYESNGISRGMWTVSWFANQFQEIGAAQGKSTLDVLTAEAKEVPPGCDGLMALMDWLPATDRYFRKGAFIGFDGRHTRAHMFRAILEGLAMTEKQFSLAMIEELKHPVKKLIVTGGGAKNDVFMQLIADIYDLPTQRNAVIDAAGLGAAINAAVGVGVYANYAEAIQQMVHPQDIFQPIAANVARYQAIYERYSTLHQLTDPVMKHLATINGVAQEKEPGAPIVASWD